MRKEVNHDQERKKRKSVMCFGMREGREGRIHHNEER